MRAGVARAAASLRPRGANFTAAWTALGPSTITSATYGALSGRVSAIAVDPNDATGNTVFLGTMDGGVWKSTNAASASASAVTFAPLTDALAVFGQSAGSTAVPSLAIGAVAVQPVAHGVVLAGTGDPNDSSDSLYGEGLLRSLDGGLTWSLVQLSHDGANGLHSFVGLSTAGLAFSTTTPTLVVAAFADSAEATVEQATTAYSIPGLYVSTDAGATWAMANVYDGAQIVQTAQPYGTGQVGNAATAVVWDAARRSFYAAVRNHGYYASTDGVNWTRLAAQPGTGLTTANCPVGVNGTGAASCLMYRGALAVQPATGDLYALTVDANNNDGGVWQDLCNAGTSGLCANAAPTFANRVDAGALDTTGTTTIAQADYNLALHAAPAAAGATNLYVGTVDLYRCVIAAGASACALRNTTNALNGCNAPAAVAPAQHALASVAMSGGAPLLFVGNDGGLWRSTDGVAETGSVCAATDRAHFENLNAAIGTGGSLSQTVGLAQSPMDANVLLGGFGENGSASTIAASQGAAWPQMSAGEGGLTMIDPVTPANWLATIGAGVNVKECTAGTNCTAADFVAPATVGTAQVGGDAALLDAPVLLDPALPTELLAGTCRVWRGPASTGATWSSSNAISAAFGGGATPCTASSPLVRSLAAGGPAVSSANVQNSGASVIVAGLAGALDGGTTALGGHVFLTTTANINGNTSAWKDIAKSPVTNDTANAGVFNPYGFDVSSVAIDAHDAAGATIYAAISGFGAGATPHLYRSTDFGAHWLNVSANLPDAPANVVVVDPNDANTVYLAMDAGVYATTAITTCATASCWNLLGTGLPNAPVTALAAAAKLPTGDGRAGMLRAGTYGRGIWQTPLLAAISTAAPGMTLSASQLAFGSVATGASSATQQVLLTSTGTSSLVIGRISIAGDWSETDTCAGQSLAPNTTCAITLTFSPTAVGARAGTLTIYANISGGQGSVALMGTGTQPPTPASVVLTPTTLSFAATTVNATSAAQIVTVANTGGSSTMLQTPMVTGDFSLAANTCTSTLASQTACSLAIAFTPTASGTRNGTLTIATGAGTLTAMLTGTGSASATDTLAPPALSFPATVIGSASAPLSVTLTNSGDAALTLITTAVSSSEFAATNNCGATLAAHATCAITVVFAPSATGQRTATLSVGDAFRTQTVTLTGTAQAGPGVTVAPVSLSFGASGVGLTSTAQTLTLTNNGGTALQLTSVVASGDFALAANTCGATVAVNAACSLTVVFSPTAAGTRTGAISFTDNAAGGVQTVALAGTGIDFSFSASGPTTATIAASGGSATFPMLLAAQGGVSATAALSCSGAPAHTTCIVTPSSTTIGSPLPVSVVVSTGVAGAQSEPGRDALPWERGSVLALALMVLPWMRRRRLGTCVLAMVASVVLVSVMGCGSSRVIPASTGGGGTTAPTTPTPSGVYTLMVNATAAGVTHSVGLSVTVQ